MAHDPRDFAKFTVKNCPQDANDRVLEDTNRREFFDSLGKIGDIEVLNRFGDGKISSGLRTLSKLSDSVRTGDTDSAIIPNSAGYVFETVDINANAAVKAGQFNPGVLNRAVGQAESIIDSVRSGTFKLENIPDVFSDLQNLSSLVDGVYTDGDNTSLKDIEICGASPYAIDLIRYAPKYKFLFVVEIQLDRKYQDVFTDSKSGQSSAKEIAFVVKNSTRPNITIEHEEINMYNFWTRVPKRTVFEPVTMKFYDDIAGKAHKFYSTYLKNISPITRQGGMGQAGVLSVPWFEANSMNPNSKGIPSTASIGALSGNNTSIVTEIRLYQIVNYGREMTVYHFHHPKMLSMNLDELDMAASGEGSEIELQFAYDAFTITPAFSVEVKPARLTEMTGGDAALYPIVPNYLPFKSNAGTEYADDDEGGDDDMPSPEPEEEGLIDSVTAGVTSANSSIRTAISSAFDSVSDFGGSFFR